MLGEGEFDKRVSEDGIEVWVTMMGPYLNMNTAFIDRSAGIVAIVDPFDASEWGSALSEEGLSPTHLLYTHTHRDHAAGYPGMIALYPELEVWGHVDARVPGLLGHVVFGE
ncbi:MAG: MBL fold metallo-hydrolase, partial [Candidatus Thermoplasmatota archaeon]|nr:MBL fold metallo-hydrolase [Candidatus Thermoplasmatota archaeon]